MSEAINRYLSSDEKYIAAIGINVDHNTIHADFPLHTHDFNETFIIVSGCATHVLGGWEYPLRRGDVFAIKGDAAHGFRDVQALEIINLMYEPGFFQNLCSEIRSIPGFDPFFLIEPEMRLRRDDSPILALDDAALAYVVMMADFILEQQRRNSTALYPVLRMNFQALVSYLATQYDVRCGSSSQASALSRAAAYMEQHFSSPIKLADIAASVFLSPRHLERLYNKYYGESPMRYLQKMRLKNALILLVQRKEPIADVARQCGFDDLSYFSRVFHQTYGITPSDARKHLTQV